MSFPTHYFNTFQMDILIWNTLPQQGIVTVATICYQVGSLMVGNIQRSHASTNFLFGPLAKIYTYPCQKSLEDIYLLSATLSRQVPGNIG